MMLLTALQRQKPKERILSPDTVSCLRKVINEDSSGGVRTGVSRTLAYAGQPGYEVLVDAIQKGDAKARLAGVEGFSDVPQISQGKYLSPLLEDPNPEVRRMVVQRYGTSGVLAKDKLLALLDDPDPVIANAASISNYGPTMGAVTAERVQWYRDGFSTKQRPTMGSPIPWSDPSPVALTEITRITFSAIIGAMRPFIIGGTIVTAIIVALLAAMRTMALRVAPLLPTRQA
jgi:hypothetical protein